MFMSRVLPGNCYLVGLNDEIVPAAEESDYIASHSLFFLNCLIISEAAKCLKHLHDSEVLDE